MKTKFNFFASLLMFISLSVNAQTVLNERCVINVLNRTIQVGEDGGWALPNVPSSMGRVRARATCVLENGSTVSGQSDYFTLTNNSVTKVGDIKFETLEAIPTEINFAPGKLISLTGIGKTQQLKVVASYRAGDSKDVTAASSGINYSTTNLQIATVSAEGVVTARGNGNVVINARKDGVLASQQISITTSGDLDHDGIPDDWELANGLNPSDPVDAQEDKDSDGLTAFAEYSAGTNPSLADSDGDGLSDYREVKETHTSALLADTDGDGLNDNIELLTNTNPLLATSADYKTAVQSILVTPPTVVLTFNGVDTEVSTQLKVTGKLIDGSTVDLTSKARGTTYSSSDLSVVNFGAEDGKLFAGKAGKAVITITNGTRSFPLAISVESFSASALSALAMPGYANNVDIVGDYAYVASGDAGLQVVDVSNRKSPKIVGSLDTDGISIDVRVRGNLAYLADGEAGLKVIDVTNPTLPVLVGSLDTAGVAQDLQVYGSYGYIATGASGIEIIDITKPQEPHSVGVLSDFGVAKGIDVEGNVVTVVAGSSLYTIDVSDKSNPIKIGSINLGDVKDVVVKSGYAYVAVFANGYRVVNIVDPTNPVVTGGDAIIASRDVELNNGFAFFAEQLFPNVVAYVNVQNPETPFFQGTVDLEPLGDYAGTGIALDASYAYVTEESYYVGQDYGTRGATKLFIAQYRMLNDTNGLAPSVSITDPYQGQVVVENKSILIKADALDDIAVKQVEFLVDDVVVSTDTTMPYEIPFVVPANKRFLNIRARATDLGSNAALSDNVRLNIQPDKDKDDLGDEQEDVYKTNPMNPDTDGDGAADGLEVAIGTNPLVVDTDNDGLIDGVEVSQGTDPLNPDISKPGVEYSSPVANAVAVPENQGISVRFNEPLSPKSIRAGVFSLKEQGSLVIAGSLKLLAGGKELLFTPNDLLKDYTEYVLRIDGVRDLAGNPLVTPYTFKYTTGNVIDVTRPIVSTMTPTSGSTNIPVNSLLTFVMSEPIDPTSVSDTRLYVTDTNSNQTLAGSLSVSEDKQTISFFPNRAFLVGRTHQVSMSGVKDLFGNEMYAASFNFTTAFEADGKSPEIVSTTVNNGDTGVSPNSTLKVLFNEPVNGLSVKLISLEQNGVPVPSERSIVNANRTLSLKPIAQLQANTIYEFVIGAVADLSGNLLAKEKRIRFTTNSTVDTQYGTVLSVSPVNTSVNVPLTSRMEIKLSEAVDPTSLKQNSIQLINGFSNKNVEGRVEVNADRKSILFVPSQPLNAGTRYTFYALSQYGWSDVLDPAGNSFIGATSTFSTLSAPDSTPPAQLASSFPVGTTNIPVNTRISISFNEALSASCINNQTVKLIRKSDSAVFAGTVALTADTFGFTFTANTKLDISTNYELVVDGVCDISGNKLGIFRHGFTTSSSSTLDSTPPTITTRFPASGEVAVAPDSKIILAFNEPIDGTQINKIQVFAGEANGTNNYIKPKMAGKWELGSDNKLTFTPAGNYPANTNISLDLSSVADVVGNKIYSNEYYYYYFTTSSLIDSVAPTVQLITPANGSMDVGPLSQIVLTFSEALRESTINKNNFSFYVDGSVISPTVSRSIDNRTVTLTGPLPSGKLISVVATSDITDLSGNPLVDFVSTFSTGFADNDSYRPRITHQFPIDGATDLRELDHLTLYVDKPLNSSSILGGVFVAADGVLLTGKSTLSASNQAITFVPDASFPENSVIEVFLTDKIKDNLGNLLYNYRGTIRTGNKSGSTIGVKPVVTAQYPVYGQTKTSLNPLIALSFNETIKLGSISPTTVQLRKTSVSGTNQQVTLRLSDDGHVVSIKPLTSLDANSRYYVNIVAGIEDVDGDKSASSYSYYFDTGADSVIDTQPPIITRSSPANGAVNIPVNPAFHVSFDEPIQPFSVAMKGNDQLSFLEGNREIVYVKDHVLPENIEVTEDLAGVSDESGNVLTTSTFSFKTTSVLDITSPTVVSGNPTKAARDVPVNTVIRMLVNEPVDPFTATALNFKLQDMSTYTLVDASVGLGPNGRELVLTPSKPLSVNTYYYVVFNKIKDLAGNVLSSDYTFTTGFTTDIESPQIEAIGIGENQTVPSNARIRVRFDEPISMQKLDNVVLTLNGTPVTTVKSLNNSGNLLTLTPQQLLNVGTYQLRISGVEDRSGNVLKTPVTRTFQASAKFDSSSASVTVMHHADRVPLNYKFGVTLNKVIDPATILPKSVVLQVGSGGWDVDGHVEVGEDKKSLFFVPNKPLLAGEGYTLWVGRLEGLYDLAGNNFGNLDANYGFGFAAGSAVDLDAPVITVQNFPAGSVNIPVNGQVVMSFNEPLASICVSDRTVRLQSKNNALQVEGKVSLSDDLKTLIFSPKNNLLSSTAYELIINGVCDLTGNTLSGLKHGFTTSSSGVADILRPTLVSTVPAAATSNVVSNSKITVTFNEPIDAARLSALQVTASGISGQLAGSWSVNKNTLTFTPLTGYPSLSDVYVYLYGLYDLAGNAVDSNVFSFSVGAAVDSTPPSVMLITPANGSMNAAYGEPIVITFSESLREDTITPDNFILYVNGQINSGYVTHSADNRTITIFNNLAQSDTVAVVLTNNITDLAGNKLVDFVSTYGVAARANLTDQVRVVRQSPLNGATDVHGIDHITILANKKLDVSSLPNVVHVAADGVIVKGSSTLDSSGYAIIFKPDFPFPNNALIEVFLEGTLKDSVGTSLYGYSSGFRTGSNSGSTPGVLPVAVAQYPVNAQSGLALNPIIEVTFNETLNPSSITADTIQLRKLSASGTIIASSLSVVADGRTVRIKPQVLLERGTRYYVRVLPNIEDVDTDKLATGYENYFDTATDAVADTQPPVVIQTSPINGASNTPLNLAYHLRFEEQIQPSSFIAKGNDQVTFLAGNKEILYIEDKVLPENTQVKKAFSGITDSCGNPMVGHEITFTTGNKVDERYPIVEVQFPEANATGVPVNTAITLWMDGPINPLTVSASNLYLMERNSGAIVNTGTSLSADGRRLTLTPLASLAMNSSYTIHFSRLADFANNSNINSYWESSFTTGSLADSLPPQIVMVGIDDNQQDVPLNGRVNIRFNEPINSQKLDGVTLSINGIPTKVQKLLSDDRLLLSVIPSQLLVPNSAYLLSVNNVEDLAGNVLAVSKTVRFTTSYRLSNVIGSQISLSPITGATNVPLNVKPQARFTERFDPATVHFMLVDRNGGIQVDGHLEIDADRKGFVFIPTQPLIANHWYDLWNGYNQYITDVAGNRFSYDWWSFTAASQ